jgi:putative oxidoreductase
MSALQGVTSVLGRLLLVTIFLSSALMNKIPNFQTVAGVMQSAGVPLPQLSLAVTIVLLLAGGTSVLLGYKARVGAAMLAVFLVLATYYFHAFWAVPADQAQGQMIHFLKNAGLLGAMLFVVANGSGAWSLDRVLARRDGRLRLAEAA